MAVFLQFSFGELPYVRVGLVGLVGVLRNLPKAVSVRGIAVLAASFTSQYEIPKCQTLRVEQHLPFVPLREPTHVSSFTLDGCQSDPTWSPGSRQTH